MQLPPGASMPSNVDQLSAPLREALSALPGITVTHVGLLDAVAKDARK